MKRILLSGVAALGAAVGGCIVAADGHGGAVVIAPGHIHTDFCGHYHRGGRWHVSHGHRHGHGCGHAYRGGIWVSIH